MSGLTGASNLKVDGEVVGRGNALPTYVPCYRKSVEITRPADTTPYAIGDIVNAANATALPKISFGAQYANRCIQVTGASVITDGTNKIMKLLFYNSSDINGAGPASIKADNTAFVPLYSEHKDKSIAQPLTVDSVDDIGTLQLRTVSQVIRKLQLDANGDCYFAPVIMETLTPNSGQKFSFVFYCYVL